MLRVSRYTVRCYIRVLGYKPQNSFFELQKVTEIKVFRPLCLNEDNVNVMVAACAFKYLLGIFDRGNDGLINHYGHPVYTLITVVTSSRSKAGL